MAAPEAPNCACEAIALYQAWRGALATRRPAATARTYRGFVFRWVEATLADPTTVDAAALRRYLTTAYPPQTAKARQALGDYFSWLVRRGHRADDPLVDVRPTRFANGTKIKKALSPDELTRLLVAWHATFGERAALAALGHYYSGARPGEWIALTVADVVLGETPEVHVRATKTASERIVPLSPRGADVFTELVAGSAGRIAGATLHQYRRQLQVAASLAGIEDQRKRRPYVMRHSWATHLMQRGVPMRVVADLLGHASMRHTLGYTCPDDDDRRRGVERLD